MKLEGAAGGRFQTVMLIGIQDPEVMNRVDEFDDKLLAGLYEVDRRTSGNTATLRFTKLPERHRNLSTAPLVRTALGS